MGEATTTMTTTTTDEADSQSDVSLPLQSSLPLPTISSATTSTASSRAVLSKSWSRTYTHGPLYTGGAVQYSPHLNCLWTCVSGNVAAVDLETGRVVCKVRQDSADNNNNNNDGDAYDDDGDDSLDADSIVAFAVNAAASLMLTVSRNHLIRQYAIHHHQHPAATMTIMFTKLWGKSGHTLPVTLLQFHCSGVFCASGAVDGSCRIWDVRGAFVTHVFRTVPSPVTCLEWFPDVQLLQLAIGRDDGSLVLHNLRQPTKNNSPVMTLTEHVSAVTCVQWDTEHKLMVTAGRDAVLNLYEYSSSSTNDTDKDAAKRKKRKHKKSHETTTSTTTMKYQRLHTLPIYEQVEGLILLHNTTNNNNFMLLPPLIATAGTKGQIRFWKIRQEDDEDDSGSLRMTPHRQQTDQVFGEARGGYTQLLSLDAAAAAMDGPLLLAADAEHNLNFVSARDLSAVRTVVGHYDDILDIKILPALQPLLDHVGRRWNDEKQRLLQQEMVVATNSPVVRILNVANGSCVHVLDQQHTATVLCVDVSPTGQWIATCGKDQQLVLWHRFAAGGQDSSNSNNSNITWKCVAVAAGHTEAVGATALSRQVGRYAVQGAAARNGGGAFCVTVSRDRTLKRWNLPDITAGSTTSTINEPSEPVQLHAFASTKAHDKDINVVAVAPNDSLIATGSQDKTVKLWKTGSTLQLVATLKGHRRGVWDCQFSPHDRVLATASGDQTIKLWSLSSGNNYNCQRTFQGHMGSVLRVHFLSSGLQLVSSGADGLVKVWTVRTNECESTLDDAHNDKIWALDVDPCDGKRMITGGADAQIVVWDDTTKEQEDAKRAEEEEAILVEQRLANHLRHNEYAQALEISLERDKPHQTLKVLNAILEQDLEHQVSPTLKKHAAQWSTDRLVQVLQYCRDWNTRARNSHVAMRTVQAIVSSVPVHKLAAIDGVPEVLAGIIPYAERHFERLDRLHASSYLLDYVLSSMGAILDAPEEDFAQVESNSKLVLPPKRSEGKVDIGGHIVVGASLNDMMMEESSDDEGSEVVTIGDSDSD